MELRRAAELLFRSQSSLSSFLNPSTTLRPGKAVLLTVHEPSVSAIASRRLFSGTSSPQQHASPARKPADGIPAAASPASSSSASSYVDALDGTPEATRSTGPAPSRASRFRSYTLQADKLQANSSPPSGASPLPRPNGPPPFNRPGFNFSAPSPGGRGSMFAFPNAGSGSSLEDAKQSFARQQDRHLDINRMLNPLSKSNVPQSPPSTLTAPLSMDMEPTMRLGPSLGRTVNLEVAGRAGTIDLARGIRQLEALCSRNSVRRDLRMQRFHERPGLKRKRLASERWRRRFKQGFVAVVARVDKLRRKGW